MCNNHNPLNRRSFMQIFTGAMLMLPGLPAMAGAALVDLPKPGPTDSCPVCGMFPAKYPDWVATILFKDGHADHFDGAKDFFKYLHDMKKYARGRKKEQISGMGVTGYYATEMIDARQALYVLGSDVLGPMGHELVPHPDRYDADAFMKDHHGKRILGFDDTNMDMLLALDDGKFL